MNPRCAAKSGRHQAGIIGEDEPVAETRVMQRFARGIFTECGSIFFERGKRIEIRQQSAFHNKDRCGRRREGAILGEFSPVGRGEKKPSVRAH